MARSNQSPYLFPAGAHLGRDNVVLQATARRHLVTNYAGPLSIKTVRSGEVAWSIRGRSLAVDRSSFLIVSAGEKYSLTIDAEKPVETRCAFFAPGFVEQVALDLTSPLRDSLDAPERTGPSLPYLCALHEDPERLLVGRVQTLAARCLQTLTPSGFEQDFLLLANDLLHFYERIHEQTARVRAARYSTRQELFRRLLAGREYIHSHSAGPVSLRDVARSACLSPYHFHRGFTQAFQQTPHAYLTALRLDRARWMIESGSSVTEACLNVGFSSPAAFTRLFRSRYGSVPSSLRRNFARSGKHIENESSNLHS